MKGKRKRNQLKIDGERTKKKKKKSI